MATFSSAFAPRPAPRDNPERQRFGYGGGGLGRPEYGKSGYGRPVYGKPSSGGQAQAGGFLDDFRLAQRFLGAATSKYYFVNSLSAYRSSEHLSVGVGVYVFIRKRERERKRDVYVHMIIYYHALLQGMT